VNVIGHPSVAGGLCAALRVLLSDHEGPDGAVLGVCEVPITGIAHFVGTEVTAAHQLHSDLMLPVNGTGRPFQLFEFVGREPALRDVARIVDACHGWV